ncbi:hypothetical protein E3T26_02355 [Cryobacterium sp. TMT1-21]|uniref:Uncharacterized protein n=1 Tax=Cryobacterium shii TaxID=1259235 RepID=A0AAQ2C5X7_9MICO|nr:MULTISPECIES: hypothetical protein [Cryobacterium]TFC46420.1 hypothetical protein E3O49_09940 [Cryobacterium shii]TFC84296.1 hypothetical protein E3T24_10580 [Cryobacterium sp. TmT2-59]TFD12087.1 hypothetical protein E3T42_15365 [Cryobacterium sp. TMT4-10]TFD17342.1 hypothetical protein E3T26_02355 [Cryobacterium sp. TMT1-21]TFD17733.1 hypothetical protein E3T32_13620 [Cryobacterium sp. TMT2-23]
MKKISYGGESFLTTDGAADALLELVVALPDGHVSELIKLPAVNSDGDEMVVQMVVGPRSELISVPEESSAGEPDTVEAVAYLRGRVGTITAPSEVAYTEALSCPDYEWDMP